MPCDVNRIFRQNPPAACGEAAVRGEAAVCGEAAADPRLLDAFLAMGMDELSVVPGAVLPLREAIQGKNTGDFRKDLLERIRLGTCEVG